MDALLVPVGSHGDIHPFVALGIELARRGHHVTVLASPYFEQLIRGCGLEFVALGTSETYLRALDDPEIWHGTHSFKALMRWYLPWLGPTYDAILAQAGPGGARPRSLVVAHTLALPALMAQEKHGVPVVTAHISPVCIRSVHQTPPMLPGLDISGWPMWSKRLFWWLADRCYVDPALTRPLNAFRAEAGLPPVSRPFQQWVHSPLLTLGLFPEFFAPPQPDWPPQVRTCGFQYFDQAHGRETPPDVQQFLDAGPPPILFTAGTAMRHARFFFEAAVDACRRLGRRGLLLAKHEVNIPPGLPPGVLYAHYAPFSQVLPRCAALVHHGGTGTLAQGLRAGVPQLTMPMGHDMPDNTARLCRLGVGEFLPRRQFRGPAVAARLQRLLGSDKVRECCRACAGQIDPAASARRAGDLIEEAAARAQRHRAPP